MGHIIRRKRAKKYPFALAAEGVCKMQMIAFILTLRIEKV